MFFKQNLSKSHIIRRANGILPIQMIIHQRICRRYEELVVKKPMLEKYQQNPCSKLLRRHWLKLKARDYEHLRPNSEI